MTLRALLAGSLLAIFIATVTFFNDWVVSQTHLVGNHLPIGVFGIVLLLLMLLNPTLRLLRRDWMLEPGELAMIAAMGLMVCVWAGSNFSRTFVANMSLPPVDLRGQSAWQSANVMSYVPGGSPEVAAGHILDWPGLLAAMRADRPEALTAITSRLSEEDRRLIDRLGNMDRIDSSTREQLLRTINHSLIDLQGVNAERPLYADESIPPEDDAAVQAYLDERDEALATIESLQSQRETLQANYDAALAEVADEMASIREELDTIMARSRELQTQSEQTRIRIAQTEDPAEAEQLRAELKKITAELAQLDAREQPLSARLRELDEPLSTPRRELARNGWQTEHYQQVAEIMTRKANRAALVALLPEILLPAPTGSGVILNYGEVSPFASERLVSGWDGSEPLRVKDLPWWTWWPTLRTWGGIVLLLTLGLLCLAIIVHPQWTKRELLNYPIVRFIDEITEPGGVGGLPKVMSSKLFWIAFGTVVAIHLLNGLTAWFPEHLIAVPLRLDFNPARSLFPNIAKANMAFILFAPTIFFSAVGFAFFLNKEISLSVGVSLLFWCVFSGVMIANDVAVTDNFYGSGISQMLRFGAYLGLALIIGYTGRRYYLDVAASAFGKSRAESTPLYAVWAARGMILCLLGCGLMMHLFLGLDWILIVLFIGCVIVMSLGMARVNVESGLFFFQPYWMPIGVITAMIGTAAIGPEALIALALASAVIMTDPRESAMPFFSNALCLGDRVGKTPIRRQFPVLALVLVVGFFLALIVAMYWQYTNGVAVTDGWARGVSRDPFNVLASSVSQLDARGELTASNTISGLQRIAAATADRSAMTWGITGMALVIGFAVARLRLSWWPLHPLIFLIWGNYASSMFAFSFLIGWFIKVMVTKFGGAKGYRTALPFMVGLIAGELISIFGWMIVGWVYFYVNGTTPTLYRILPG